MNSNKEIIRNIQDIAPYKAEAKDYGKEEKDRHYEVRAITDHKFDKTRGLVFYLLYEGYTDSEGSWERLQNINAKRLLMEYVNLKGSSLGETKEVKTLRKAIKARYQE